MTTDKESHFPDQYIDAIADSPEENYFLPVLRETLECMDEPPASVCDVGCGNGVFSVALKRWTGCRLVGMDGSEYALGQARVLGFDELHLIGDLSIDNLPAGDGVHDLVINKDVLEHLLRPEHLVAEISRITRPGGYALVHVPNHFPIVGRLRLLFRNEIDPFDYFPDAKRWDFPHIRFFTLDSLCELFRRHGFVAKLDLGAHFFCAGRAGRLLPRSIRRGLYARFPDAWTEGYAVLFRKG